MIRVTKLEMTCGACPSQWQGDTDDGRPIYVRYRWGHLRVEMDDTDEVVFEWSSGDNLDGVMDLDQLKELTAGVIEWP